MIRLNTHRIRIATRLAVITTFVSFIFLAVDSNFRAQGVNLVQTQIPLLMQEIEPLQDIEPITEPQSVIEVQPASVETEEEFPAASPAPAFDPNQEDENLDVLARGPLHEAFAAAHQSNPEPAITVNKQPPQLIEELPPEFKPEGDNVVWVPGYWAWDDSESDFIWISGIWRNVPPGRKWVPGYWDKADGGYRWVSGLWAEETSDEITYLPEPPASIDQGPSVAAPSESHFYVPGNWHYQGNRYLWQSGHWQPVVKNWIWVPARYVWTPLGCVYQSGYWDYEIVQRGTCFAPVRFQRPVYLAQTYQYRPSCVVNLNVDFLTHLFVRPRCGHYFYGDWYSSSFVSFGYRPWVNYTSHYRRYDPLLAYYGCQRSRYNAGFSVVQYLANQHSFYRTNSIYRPRTTFAAQIAFASASSNLRRRDLVNRSCYVQSYADLVRRRSRELNRATNDLVRRQARFERVKAQELAQQRKRIDKVLKLQRERQRVEVRTNQKDNHRQARDVRKLKLDSVNSRIARDTARDLEKVRRVQQRDVQRELQKSVNEARQKAAKIARDKKQNLNRQEILVRRANLEKVERLDQERNDRAERARKQREQKQANTKARLEREKLARKIKDTRATNPSRDRNAVAKDQQDRGKQRQGEAARKRQIEQQQRAVAERQRKKERLALDRTKATQREGSKNRAAETKNKQELVRQRQSQAQQKQRAQAERAKRDRQQQAKANQQRLDQQRRARESAQRAADQQRRQKQQAAQRAAKQRQANADRSRQLKAQQDAARRAAARKQSQRTQVQRNRQRTASRNQSSRTNPSRNKSTRNQNNRNKSKK